MPKPNFVKKPMRKLLDEPLSKLPNTQRFVRSGPSGGDCENVENCQYPNCSCRNEQELENGTDDAGFDRDVVDAMRGKYEGE